MSGASYGLCKMRSSFEGDGYIDASMVGILTDVCSKEKLV